MAKSEARKKGASDAIMHKDGLITESSAGNIFVVTKDGELATPKAANVFQGVTRMAVIDIVKEITCNENLVIEKDINTHDILSANEVFLTGSVSELTPVVRVNDTVIGNGVPGQIHSEINKYYQKLKQS
jgi:D-alanine transaminase